MGTSVAARAARRGGFTIIELLMVVAIISLVAAWALPKFSIARYRADAAGRLVRAQLQTAQRNAITRSTRAIASNFAISRKGPGSSPPRGTGSAASRGRSRSRAPG